MAGDGMTDPEQASTPNRRRSGDQQRSTLNAMREHDRHARRLPGMLEDEVLAVLWASDHPMSPADVQATLGGTLAYTTIMTTLSRLYRKGLAKRTRVGRGFVYVAAVDEVAHTVRELHALLARRPNRTAVLQQFVSELSDEDEQILQQLLRDDTG
jgi:predicted transcriptional regulator